MNSNLHFHLSSCKILDKDAKQICKILKNNTLIFSCFIVLLSYAMPFQDVGNPVFCREP